MAKIRSTFKSTQYVRKNGRLVPIKKSVKTQKTKAPKRIKLKDIANSIKDDKIKAGVVEKLAKQQTTQMAIPELAATSTNIASTIKSGFNKTSGLSGAASSLDQNINGGLQDTQHGRDDDDEQDYPGVI